MSILKYTILYVSLVFSAKASFGQCSVPSSNPNKFELIEAGKRLNLPNDDAKYFSGGVVFLINEYKLTADSAKILTNLNSFEVFGNVVLSRNGAYYENGQKAVYREDVHFIHFNGGNIYNVEAEKPEEKSTALNNIH